MFATGYLMVLLAAAQDKEQRTLTMAPTLPPHYFPLVGENGAVSFLADTADATVVRLAARAVATDLEMITGQKPQVLTRLKKQSLLIIAGTIGQSPVIDALIQSKKLDVTAIQGRWESFIITTLKNPIKGVKRALVIAGSDPRGAAYGLFELSRAAGVSPWVWWADAVPAKRHYLSVPPDRFVSSEPSVKYRGIFLNDEDWGLQPWAAKTFERETGDIGPKTYAKIFELLLRLRANMIWPAMHPSTKAFFSITGNAKVAADYAILIGSSHAEPMLRNNVGEWNEKTMGPFNYVTNRQRVYQYWEERVKQSSGINAIYTLGMRGIHDSGMEGVKNAKEAVPLLEQVFKDQRGLLAQYIHKNLSDIPQVFTAYKEVLDIYDNGLKLPADVTLVWPDDNYGYIQRLNDGAEQKRPGGSGVYYHASYWGRPHDYLWISSTNPSLMREEMMKAYDNGSNRLWVVNVGDIKPLEYATELFLDMAYDVTPFKENNDYQQLHLLKWVARIFGNEAANVITPILRRYYQLAFERKPEFMGWSQTEPTTKTNLTGYNHFFYGDEATQRINAYRLLEDELKAIRKKVPPDYEASFYQLVFYPVVSAALMNQKFLYRDNYYLYSRQGRLSATDYAQLSQAAYDSIISLTDYYNNGIAGGKWKHIMSMKPRDLPVFQAPELLPVRKELSDGWSVAPEGWINPDSSLLRVPGQFGLPPFDPLNRQAYFIDIFLQDSVEVSWTAIPSDPCIQLSAAKGVLKPVAWKKDFRLYVFIDWKRFFATSPGNARVILKGRNKEISIALTFRPLSVPGGFRGFIENNGYVSLQAVHYNEKADRASCYWNTLAVLGYTGASLEAKDTSFKPPVTDTSLIRGNSSWAAYDFYTFTLSAASLTVFSLPTQPLNNNFSMRYAVSVDEGPIQVVDFRTSGRSEEWKQNVLRNRAQKKVSLGYLDKGIHRLKVYCIDPGVILDAMLIDLGGLKPAYGSIPETRLIPVPVNADH